MEEQKIINLLEETDDDDINDQNNGQYGKGDENDTTIKFNTEVIKPHLNYYSDAYILVTGNTEVVNGNDNTDISFKNCSSFIRSVIHINDEHIETVNN